MISPSWTRTAAVVNSPATLNATVGSSGQRALRSRAISSAGPVVPS